MSDDAIPFLRPNLPPSEAYLESLIEMDKSRIYSNYGPMVSRFESQVLRDAFLGRGGFCTVNNATIGLMLAIRQAKKKGKYALMPSFTFAATPLAAQWAGLEPYFLDVDPHTWCLNQSEVTRAINLLGEDLAAVVPYATFGSDMDLSFYGDIHRNGLPVVVDAAASFGTRSGELWFGQDFPGFVVFSFHATKAFGIGEGGAVYSGDPDSVARFRRAGNFAFGPDRASSECGLNSKLPEIGGAIALAAWDAFPRAFTARREIHSWYREALEIGGYFNRGWAMQASKGEIPHQFMPLLAPRNLSVEDVLKRLKEGGIEARHYFMPACHQQPAFADFRRSSLDVTDAICSRILSLPLWEGMGMTTVTRVVKALEP